MGMNHQSLIPDWYNFPGCTHLSHTLLSFFFFFFLLLSFLWSNAIFASASIGTIYSFFSPHAHIDRHLYPHWWRFLQRESLLLHSCGCLWIHEERRTNGVKEKRSSLPKTDSFPSFPPPNLLHAESVTITDPFPHLRPPPSSNHSLTFFRV